MYVCARVCGVCVCVRARKSVRAATALFGALIWVKLQESLAIVSTCWKMAYDRRGLNLDV